MADPVSEETHPDRPGKVGAINEAAPAYGGLMMREILPEERPRERLREFGERSLSTTDLIALMLNEIRRLANFYRLLFFLPFVTSTIAISWVFRILFERQGYINSLLATFSLPPQPFLRSPDQALYSILVVVVWQGLGFAVIIFLAGLKQISQSYYEAARIDGASRWQSFRHITIPLLNPTIVFLVILQSIAFVRMFAPVYAMTVQGSGGPLNSTTTVVLRVVREAFDSNNMGFAAALTVVLFVIILFVTVLQLKLTTRQID